MKNCEYCSYRKKDYDYRGCEYYRCGRPGGCYDSETYKVKTPPQRHFENPPFYVVWGFCPIPQTF